MRAILMASIVWLLAGPALAAEDILAVLERSQQMQLDALSAGEIEPARQDALLIQESFDEVLAAVGRPVDVRLIVVEGPLLAVCLMGRVVAVNVSLAKMRRSERLFVLAHEVGHAVQQHWPQLGALYKRHIPDEVVQHKTDAVAGALGRDASELSHRHEYEADAFALRLIRHMGQPDDTPIVLFQHLPLVKATATHPGTRQRLAQMRLLNDY